MQDTLETTLKIQVDVQVDVRLVRLVLGSPFPEREEELKLFITFFLNKKIK